MSILMTFPGTDIYGTDLRRDAGLTRIPRVSETVKRKLEMTESLLAPSMPASLARGNAYLHQADFRRE
jgi:hypothetical protein